MGRYPFKSQINCEICKKSTPRTSSFQLYCPECRIIQYKAQKNKYEKERLKRPDVRKKYLLWTNDWRKKNKVKIAEKQKIFYEAKKRVVLQKYGGKCSCCDENNPAFLTIDHINNDGAIWRKSNRNVSTGYGFYNWIIRNDYPKDLRIQCYNCNCGRFRNNGICPHEVIPKI